MHRPQRLGHPGLGDVAVGVDEHAVLTETLFGRPRLDLHQVDATERELVEHPHQQPRTVLSEEDHHRGLVGTGRAADPTTEREEAGGVAIEVLDVRDEDLESRSARLPCGSRVRPRCRRSPPPLLRPVRSKLWSTTRCRAGSRAAIPGTAGMAMTWERTCFRSFMVVPGRTNRFMVIGTVISPRMYTPGAPKASVSRVRLTAPSIEFSMGTTPTSTRSSRTRSTTSVMVVRGSAIVVRRGGRGGQRREGALGTEEGDLGRRSGGVGSRSRVGRPSRTGTPGQRQRRWREGGPSARRQRTRMLQRPLRGRRRLGRSRWERWGRTPTGADRGVSPAPRGASTPRSATPSAVATSTVHLLLRGVVKNRTIKRRAIHCRAI